MTAPSIILGFDLGLTYSAPTAAALCDFYAGRILWHDCIAIRGYKRTEWDSKAWADRVACIFLSLLNLPAELGGFVPEAVAWERPFVGKNPDSALNLQAVAGAVIAFGATYNFPLFPVSVAQGKISIGGEPDSSKEEIMGLVAASFNLRFNRDTKRITNTYTQRQMGNHEADAVSIAAAGWGMAKNQWAIQQGAKHGRS